MDLNDTITQSTGMSYDEIWAILPCVLLGIFCGIASYFQNFLHDENFKPSVRKLVANGLVSAIMSFIIFACLDSTDFSFMTKLAISSAVAFLGIDRALDIAQKLLSLRGNKDA